MRISLHDTNLPVHTFNALAGHMDLVQAFSILNPSTPLRDNPHWVEHEHLTKELFGTTKVIWFCEPVGHVGALANLLTRRCVCGGSLILDLPEKFARRLVDNPTQLA